MELKGFNGKFQNTSEYVKIKEEILKRISYVPTPDYKPSAIVLKFPKL